MRRTSLCLIAVALIVSCDGTAMEKPGTSTGAAAEISGNGQATAIIEPSATDVQRIVDAVMDEQYGERDEANRCWHHVVSEGGVETEYCMRAAAPDVIEAASGKLLFVRAFNAIDNDAVVGYDAVTPGVMGGFELHVDPSGRWSYVAKEPSLLFGTMGYCGCDQAQFVRLGKDLYGWMFVSGGTWQGSTVSYHEVVAPSQGRFRDISDIPEIREENQDVRYRAEIVAGSGVVYPMKVTKLVSGKAVSERVVDFNQGRHAFVMPEDL